MKDKIFIFIRIIITLGLFFIIFKIIPYSRLIGIYKNANPFYLLLAISIFFLSIIVAILRWQFLLNSLGVKVFLGEAFLSSFSGFFFNLFFPSFIAGDVFKGFTISYRHGEVGKVATSVIMDRFNGALGLGLIALFSFAIGGELIRSRNITFALLALLFFIFCSFLFIFSKTFFRFFTIFIKKNSLIMKKLNNFHNQLYFFRQNPSIFIRTLFFSFLTQIFTCLGFFMSAKAFGIDLSVVYFFIIVPIIMVIALIPITIAGAGTREAASIYFFSLVGIDKATSLSISFVNLFFMIFIGMLGGIIYVIVYHRRLQSNP
jgi:hypothetical protein